MGGARNGAPGGAGQERRQFHLPEGGRAGISAPRPPHPPLRSRRRGDALRRAGTGRHLCPQDRRGAASLQASHRRRIPRRRHHLRPQHPRGGHRYRSPRRLRPGLHRSRPLDQAKPAPRQDFGRRVESIVRLPGQQRRARGHAFGVSLPRHPSGYGHGDRQSPNAANLQRHRTGTARTGRGCYPLPPRRRRRTLTEYASQFTKTGATQTQHTDAWRSEPLGKRIEYAMLKGVADYIEQDALEATARWARPWR